MDLPFKPFSFDEVQAITGVHAKVMDQWGQTVLTPLFGDDKFSVGFNDAQTFAIFVGSRYLEEGAGMAVATAVVRCLGNYSLLSVQGAIDGGCLIVAPAELRVGGARGAADDIVSMDSSRPVEQRLRLDKLLAEFWHRVRKVFPNG